MNENARATFPAGVVTLLEWTMMPDGSTYKHVWAREWRVITNKASGIEHLRTGDSFHACGCDNDGNVVVIIPGCQVKGFAACRKSPQIPGGSVVYSVGDAR